MSAAESEYSRRGQAGHRHPLQGAEQPDTVGDGAGQEGPGAMPIRLLANDHVAKAVA